MRGKLKGEVWKNQVESSYLPNLKARVDISRRILAPAVLPRLTVAGPPLPQRQTGRTRALTYDLICYPLVISHRPGAPQRYN